MAARVGLLASLIPCVQSPLLPQMYEKYNAVLRFFSGKARYTVKELAKMAKGKEPASLEEKRKAVPFLQQKCGWLGLGKWTEEAHGTLVWVWENKYTTTLHAINSVVLKLSKLTKAASVYRGFTGATLPASFFKPNEENVCGGIEYGFSSTTTAEEQAHHYAAGKASTVFEMRMGLIDRGAEVDWLSQCTWAIALEALSCPRLLAAPHPTGACPLAL